MPLNDKNKDAIHVFPESVADRLRTMTYEFSTAIDEFLYRTRCFPKDQGVGLPEIPFLDARDALRLALKNNHPSE